MLYTIPLTLALSPRGEGTPSLPSLDSSASSLQVGGDTGEGDPYGCIRIMPIHLGAVTILSPIVFYPLHPFNPFSRQRRDQDESVD
jgi:hypothetical protein